MTDKVLIRLPWPPKVLSPNGRTRSHAYKHRVEQEYKRACMMEALPFKQKLRDCEPEAIVITFHPLPRGPLPDRDNAIASFKYGQDALAETWGINDAVLRPSYEFGSRVPGGCVIVEIMARRAGT